MRKQGKAQALRLEARRELVPSAFGSLAFVGNNVKQEPGAVLVMEALEWPAGAWGALI